MHLFTLWLSWLLLLRGIIFDEEGKVVIKLGRAKRKRGHITCMRRRPGNEAALVVVEGNSSGEDSAVESTGEKESETDRLRRRVRELEAEVSLLRLTLERCDQREI